MKITIEVDDEELRRVLAPVLAQPLPAPPPQTSKLLTVAEVAQRLAISRNKAYLLIASGDIRSVELGRSRRVSEASLVEFINRPREQEAPRFQAPAWTPQRPTPSPPPQPRPRRPRQKGPPAEIDLSPSPDSSSYSLNGDALERVLMSLGQQGVPPDVVDQMRQDADDGVRRVYLLGINDVKRYLGISRYAVLKLVESGRLRLLTMAPSYANEKPSQRIPAKDVLAVHE